MHIRRDVIKMDGWVDGGRMYIRSRVDSNYSMEGCKQQDPPAWKRVV